MKKNIFLLFVFSFSMSAQTVLINPATDGGFENGSTFAANGWTTVNHTTNNWYCGSSSAGSPLAHWWSGSRGAYISNNGGSNWEYTGTTAQASHLYKDIAFPAGQSTITLTFDIRMVGDVGVDNLQVYITDTAITPTNAGPIGANTTSTGWPGYTNGTTGHFLYSNFNSVTNTTTSTVSYTFTEAQGLYCAGNTKRLIFTWKNNATVAVQAPVSIDNIALNSSVPPTNNSCTSPTLLSVNPTEICTTSTSGTTVNANNAGLAGCLGTADDDVWFSFVATSNTHNVTVNAGTIQNVVFQVFQGTCAVLTNIGCVNNTLGSGSEYFLLNGLTPGNTYFVRVYSFDNTNTSNGTFNICVASPPVGCASKAPADVSVICNETATLTAQSTQLSYSMVASACDPIAITGTNAFPTPVDDAVTGQIPLGFDFNFYGNVYNSAVIQTNGIVGFGPFTFVGYNAFSIPSGNNPNNYIAGIFTDIDIRRGGTITYESIGVAPNRQFVVSYNNVMPYGGSSFPTPYTATGTASFQIVINENGSFNIIISQFSANWLSVNGASSSALATSGSENSDGTIAFPVPLRNSTDWPGIVPTDRDCHTFVSSACTFERWQEGATVLTTNPVLNVAPTTTTAYTAVWNCGGSECSDETIVKVLPSSIIKSNVIDNTNCVFPNGLINLVTDNLNAPSYTVSYLQNGTPASQTINLTSQNIAPGDTFNSGVLTNADLKWTRNNAGSVCNASAVPSQFFDVYSFTVTTNGLYAFDMCNGATSFNGFASLYQNAFNINNPCDMAANHIISDDNGNPNAGVCDNDARISASLVTGVTYYLVTTTLSSDTTGDYNWTFVSGPGNIVNNDSYYQLTNLSAGTYTNFSITTNCGNVTFPGPIVLGDISQRTWLGTTSNDWNNPVNWSNGLIPTAINCVVIPVTANNPVISGTNYNALAYSLTVINGASLTVQPGNNLIVTDVVTVNPTGNLFVRNTANLIQINNTVNIGQITVDRIATIRNLDYVYWSSPVGNFSVAAVSPLTDLSKIYKWIPTIVTNINGFGNWQNANEIMDLGKGYAVRSPSGFSATPAPFLTSFIGVANNGNISIPISRGTYDGAPYVTGASSTLGINQDDNWNLIGNPYPSSIDAIDFLTNNTNIDGFVNIWSHNSLPSGVTTSPFYGTYAFNYSATDYITYNSTGASAGPYTYNGKIASGQGFFVSMLHASSSVSENVSFNNALRRDGLGNAYDNGQFYKTSSSVNNGRIWLDMFSADGSLNSRILVGYIDGATNAKDRMYDAFSNDKLDFNLYSLIGSEKMIIQGKTLPFDAMDKIYLGFKIAQAGNYSIGIGDIDGIFSNVDQNIYLEDLALGVIHDLRVNPYDFTEVAGINNNRFLLRFDADLLGVDEVIHDGNELFVYTSNGITLNSKKQAIQSVVVYDVMGRVLGNYKNLNQNEFVIKNIQKNNAALLLKITLSNGIVVDKKVIY
jgi:hypothetical protein